MRSSIPIEIGQRLGTGEISMQTAREKDPFVEDPELEAGPHRGGGTLKALLGGMENQAAQGTWTRWSSPVSHTERQKDPGASLAEIYVKVHTAMQAEQAAQQQGPQPAGNRRVLRLTGGSRHARQMPGAAVPPGGVPGVPPPGQGQLNLQDLVGALKAARRTRHQQMPRGKGGAVKGTVGTPYPNRSDLQASAPVEVAPAAQYGERQQQQAAQRAIPIGPSPQGPPPGASPPQGAPPSPQGQPGLSQALPAAPPGGPGILPFLHPTNRPNEPVTAGLATGPGPGPEALTGVGAIAQNQSLEQGTLKNLLGSLASRARQFVCDP